MIIEQEITVIEEQLAARDAIRPPLKWAGSKWSIASQVLNHLPSAEKLIEPFCGACGVSLYDWQVTRKFDRYALGDSIAALIHFYHDIQTDVDGLIGGAEDLWFVMLGMEGEDRRKLMYYAIREDYNELPDSPGFLFINKFGFNGLYREGKRKGNFNVPFGGMREPKLPTDELYNFREFSRRASFHWQPYEGMAQYIGDSTVIYCDPPYVPVSDTANFTGYSKGGFTEQDQYGLASFARFVSDRGTPVFISNSEAAYDIYSPGATAIHPIEANRSISCKGNGRGKVKELLFQYGQP